jgi:hypothetical protein
MTNENAIESYPHWKLDRWPADLPTGRIERIYTHWSAHDYTSVFRAYHFCIALNPAGEVIVANTHDIVENMRDVYKAPEEPYCQHTRGRNSHAIGISIMAMEGARPDDFGKYPVTDGLIDGLCTVGARIAKFYRIAIDAEHVISHAEAAVRDGYFGSASEERWDIARLAPDSRPLVPREALAVGEQLRSRMRAFAPL